MSRNVCAVHLCMRWVKLTDSVVDWVFGPKAVAGRAAKGKGKRLKS
jgi:hypothetical protein